ncbi:MAG TPA: UDP-N-acetylmuramate--L-alanine ligase [Clostridia bacterium]|nr:UDP-N-acetylmuramate--L-alanine ligase [Clostridia bacterium]
MAEAKKQKEWTHFIGIGGVGMSGLAKILLEKGYPVSGSDLAKSQTTELLVRLGATIHEGHRPEHLSPAVDRVVISSAIKEHNPELQKAKSLGIPVLMRAELLAEFMREQQAIAVAGSHGKTTTSSMIAWCLEKNGWDPTIVVGGEVNNLGVNAKLGRGNYLVAEADESDGSFLKLHPYAVLVTNVEDDHLDHYGSFDKMVQAFDEFLGLVPAGGFSAVCTDCPVTQSLAQRHRQVITYGSHPGAQFRAVEVELTASHSRAVVEYKGTYLGSLELTVPGRHNVLNALGAVAACLELGLTFDQAAGALAVFQGAKRRFQLLGTAGGVKVVDDYAHHPTEIMATLAAARQLQPKTLWAVFQPHRFTRTKQLYQAFGKAFDEADQVIVSDIYAAGESPIPGVSAQLIIDALRANGVKVTYCPGQEEIINFLLRHLQKGDLVLTLGAGDIWQTGRQLLAHL